jgi:hypothetical protein
MNAHQRTMPPIPLQNSVIVVDSETESESELESQPDRSSYVENQLGLPQYQYGVYYSSPPPVNADINNDDLNNNSKFFLRIGVQKLTYCFSKTANVNEGNDANEGNEAKEGNDPRATNTEILLSLGDKVRRLRNFAIIVLTYKIIAEKDIPL